jgi:hypothetical protein
VQQALLDLLEQLAHREQLVQQELLAHKAPLVLLARREKKGTLD